MNDLMPKEFQIADGVFHSGYEFHRVRVWDIASSPSMVELRSGSAESSAILEMTFRIGYGVMFVVNEVEL